MKDKNTTLTAAVVLAMDTTATSQASFDSRDNLLVHIASGSLGHSSAAGVQTG